MPLIVNKSILNLQSNDNRFSEIFGGYKTEKLA